MNIQTIKVYGAMLVAMFFWGISFIWTKQVFELYEPITVIILRLALSSVVLFGVGILTRQLQMIRRADMKNILILAFSQPFLYFLGENFGLSRVSTTVAAVLVATIPLFSPLAAWFFFREKISRLNFIGIFISISGVVMVILKDDLSLKADLWGVAFLLLAVAAAIGYSILVLRLTGKYNVYTLIAWQNLFGVLYFLPLFLIFDFSHFITVPFSWSVWAPLIQLAIFASSLAFMFFTYGIANLGIVKANTMSNIIPVFTAIFAWFILDEVLSLLNMFGIATVVAGLLLSQMKYDRLPHHTVRAVFHSLLMRFKSK